MKKTTTKKSPTGAPLGNPLKYFREGGEKRKAMFKNGGYNVPNNSLPRKDNGGPGSGMGRMYLDDLANEAMMAESSRPTAPVKKSSYAETPMDSLFGVVPKRSSYKEYGNKIPPPPDTTMKSMIPNPPIPNPGSRSELSTTPGQITPLNRNKKGGSVKRKKK